MTILTTFSRHFSYWLRLWGVAVSQSFGGPRPRNRPPYPMVAHRQQLFNGVRVLPAPEYESPPQDKLESRRSKEGGGVLYDDLDDLPVVVDNHG